MMPDRREMMTRRKIDFLREFLADLPPGDWRGTPTELAERMWAFSHSVTRWRTSIVVPMGRGVSEYLRLHAGVLAEAGWEMSEGRTGRGRWIELRRVNQQTT